MKPATSEPEFVVASDHSLLVRFGTQISAAAHTRVLRLLRVLDSHPIEGVRDLSPAYSSVLVRFDALRLDHAAVEEHVRGWLAQLDAVKLPEPRRVEVPACYGGEFGPDLEDVGRLRGLAPEKVIEMHAGATYRVFFLGFSPGFAYLGEVPAPIMVPRLASPRRQVPAGSVGMAGSQTGVYPMATPGGWRIIGRTPLRMFDPERQPMCLAEIGDVVRFVPITAGRFRELEAGKE